MLNLMSCHVMPCDAMPFSHGIILIIIITYSKYRNCSSKLAIAV